MRTKEEISEMLKGTFGSDVVTIGIKQLSGLTGYSVGTIKNYLNHDNYQLPKHIKLGDAKNSKIRFLLTDVVEYFYNLQQDKG